MEVLLIIAPDDLMSIGLELVEFNASRQANVKRATNLKRFKSFYGSAPVVNANIWADLLTTNIKEARLSWLEACIENYLLAIHFLKVYPTDDMLAGKLKMCVKTAQKWAWLNFLHSMHLRRIEKKEQNAAHKRLQLMNDFFDEHVFFYLFININLTSF
jgi:hypothetical protein